MVNTYPIPSQMGSEDKSTDEWGSLPVHIDSKQQPSEYPPQTIQAYNYEFVDLKGRPVNKSKTGTWKAAPYLYALNVADFQGLLGLAINLVPYLATTMHQSVSSAANITTNFVGTAYLLAVVGGFVADSYLGSFYTLCVGGIFFILGFGLLTFSTAYHGLQPSPCSLRGPCRPAGAHYMAPLYVALYTIALGAGLMRPNNISIGGDQFDDSSPKERKKGVHFFVWFYFSTNIALLIAYGLGVYLQDDVSRSWGYGFSLMFLTAAYVYFILGANIYRHKRPSGSFLTRTAQVLVASFRKWKAPTPANPQELYTPVPTTPSGWKLNHTSQLRILDKAAIIDSADKEILVRGLPNPWRLCSVTQVEESKRLALLLPVWITTAALTLVYSQLTTFTVQQGATFDRKLGPHFIIPPASLGIMMPICSIICLAIYDRFLIPVVRRYTKSPYGFPPVQRFGFSFAFAIITMICAALVERKRLTYVRELHFENLPLGAYTLPMKFWYLLPQLFTASQVEFFLYVPSFEFFYHEAAETTQSIGSSFTYSASALGYFFSTILVNITNHATRNEGGGSWLVGQLNRGGLEKFYWLLATFLGADMILFLIAAYFYRYKYDWYRLKTSQPEKEDTLARNRVAQVDVNPL